MTNNYCVDVSCPYNNLSMQCISTACIKPKAATIIRDDENNIIIFPYTIGDITFHSKGELIDWVITQQRWGKDPNFGAGN